MKIVCSSILAIAVIAIPAVVHADNQKTDKKGENDLAQLLGTLNNKVWSLCENSRTVKWSAKTGAENQVHILKSPIDPGQSHRPSYRICNSTEGEAVKIDVGTSTPVDLLPISCVDVVNAIAVRITPANTAAVEVEGVYCQIR